MPHVALNPTDLARGRAMGAPLGGKALVSKAPPIVCSRCGVPLAGRSYHSYLGHLGLHGLADRYFAGDVQAAQERLRANGLARQDPAAGNGAWPSYRPIGGQGG